MMWGYWGNGGPGALGWIGMGIGMLLNLGIVILIIYMISRMISRGNFASHNNFNAADILKERLARGEIDEEEYHKKLEIINRR